MSEVKRYESGVYYCSGDAMVQSTEGDYVSYEDYATLKVQRDALAALTATPVKRPKNIGPGYASAALSTRDEQWYDAIGEAGYEVQE